jgi:hypothetical protein
MVEVCRFEVCVLVRVWVIDVWWMVIGDLYGVRVLVWKVELVKDY